MSISSCALLYIYLITACIWCTSKHQDDLQTRLHFNSRHMLLFQEVFRTISYTCYICTAVLAFNIDQLRQVMPQFRHLVTSFSLQL